MIDLYLWASSEASLTAWFTTQGLLDDESNAAKRVTIWPWFGDGKLQRTPAVIDENGDVTAPPTYVPGYLCHVRIADPDDAINEVADPENPKQWERSKVAKTFKGAASGDMEGIGYLQATGPIRLLDPADVATKLSEWGVPRHVYL